jgi:helix-turn-helix protein
MESKLVNYVPDLTEIDPSIHWLTTRETAKAWRIGSTAVARAARRGVIPAQHIGRTPGGQRLYRRTYVESTLPREPEAK